MHLTYFIVNSPPPKRYSMPTLNLYFHLTYNTAPTPLIAGVLLYFLKVDRSKEARRTRGKVIALTTRNSSNSGDFLLVIVPRPYQNAS